MKSKTIKCLNQFEEYKDLTDEEYENLKVLNLSNNQIKEIPTKYKNIITI